MKTVQLKCQRCGDAFEVLSCKKASKFCKKCSRINRSEYLVKYNASRRKANIQLKTVKCRCGETLVVKASIEFPLCKKCKHEDYLAYIKAYNLIHKKKSRLYYKEWHRKQKEIQKEQDEKKIKKTAWTAYQLMRLPAEKWEEVLRRPGFCITEIGSIPYGKVTSWNWFVATH